MCRVHIIIIVNKDYTCTYESILAVHDILNIYIRTHEDDDKEEKRFLNMEGDQAFKTLIIKQEGKFKKKRKRNKGKI